MSYTIRLATPLDSEAILRIYAPYVLNTAISFEVEVPTVSEFAGRIEAIGTRYPYLVCKCDHEIVGYAYASQHRERAAYQYDVDVSIYILPEHHGLGIAQNLYECLLSILKELGYYNAYAACTMPNEKSIRFHEKMGFSLIGIHHRTGYKLGKWRDVIWFEKAIQEDCDTPMPVKSISDLTDEQLGRVVRTR